MTKLREQEALTRTQSCKTVDLTSTRMGIVVKQKNSPALFGETTERRPGEKSKTGKGKQ